MSPESSNAENGEHYAVAEVVPHAGRMILIDEIVDYDQKGLTARVDITSSSLFLSDEQSVPVRVGIEYMAQSIAAWAGIHAKGMGQAIKLGYLLGSRRYQSLITSFTVGDSLLIKVQNSYEANDIGVFECQIVLHDEVVVTATLNVYQPQ